MSSKRFKTEHAIACVMLLVAFVVRVYALDSLPPGLTHDEANHGHEALEVLNGITRYYFPLGYGREPLYAYFLAGWMGLIGVSPFALRLLIPMGMVVCHAAVYRWTNKLFGKNVALLSLAILAVGWWPLVSSRQALRSGFLPLITIGLAAATYQLWLNSALRLNQPSLSSSHRERIGAGNLWPMLGIAVLIGLMLHTYIAARVLWVFIPAFGVYLMLIDVKRAGRFWLTSLPAVLGGLLLSAPLFIYLRNNPGLETRLDMLDGPLVALRDGNVLPILKNMWRTVLGLIWPGAGDKFLAYNIPGKQTLAPLTAIFFTLGVFKSLIRWRTPKYILLLLWLGVGLAPSLITGPTAATTRSIGAFVPIYVLAALGVCFFNTQFVRILNVTSKPSEWVVRYGVMFVWIVAAASYSIPVYFTDWGQRPDVRAAYQATMIDALKNGSIGQANTVISSVLPGHAHDPTIAEIILPSDQVKTLNWSDGRFALVFPAGASTVQVIAPSSANLHPVFREAGAEEQVSPMRPDDLDPFWTTYELEPWPTAGESIATLSDAISLDEARWLADTVSPNGVAELLTVWTVRDPVNLGSTIPYVGYPDTNMFVHVLNDDGSILTQVDRLDAPSWAWGPGDRIVQVHQIYIGPDVALGEYKAVVGVYDRLTGIRLVDQADESVIKLPSLIVDSN